jgi:hypothetical protein
MLQVLASFPSRPFAASIIFLFGRHGDLKLYLTFSKKFPRKCIRIDTKFKNVSGATLVQSFLLVFSHSPKSKVKSQTPNLCVNFVLKSQLPLGPTMLTPIVEKTANNIIIS